MSTTSESKTGKTDWVRLAILITGFGIIGMLVFILYLNSNEYNNLLEKTTNIGEEGYLEINDFFFLNKDSAKYFTIKVTAVDVQSSNDDKTVLLHTTFKNIRYDAVDINRYSYYLITDEEHSYQSTELLTVDGTKVLKDTHKECIMKFNISTDEKPAKLIIMKNDRIVKEITLKSN
jgi:hypothetical protein